MMVQKPTLTTNNTATGSHYNIAIQQHNQRLEGNGSALNWGKIPEFD
jgi:hypothetical protein